MTRRSLVAVAATLFVAACAGWYAEALPAPSSLPPVAGGPAGLRAGIGRADITPAPGVALAGSGPESRSGTGYRQRLYARALVLEDGTGERMVFVVADLPHFSANIHRLVADRIFPLTGIGADRLIISVTHDHSAAGNYYSDRQYNDNTARMPGYDPHIVDFMVTRISEAVMQAYAALAPARVAWGDTVVRHATKNRSYSAYCENPDAANCPERRTDPKTGALVPASDTDPRRYHAIDTTLLMLRVDASSDRGRTYHPIGAFSIFAMHGTINPSANTLVDADVHGVVERRVEQHIDSLSPGDSDPMRPRSAYLLANGTEGDVSPDWSDASRCELPKPGRLDSLPVPRGPAETWDFIDPRPETLQPCLRQSIADMQRVGNLVGDAAVALFERLEPGPDGPVTIRRAFTTVYLPGKNGLCESPVIGAGSGAGGEDAVTRVRGWRYILWPVLVLGAEEGGTAVDSVTLSCQSTKRPLIAPIQPFLVSEHGFPDVAQFTVVRIGSLLLASVPAEATTMVGKRWRDSLLLQGRAAGIARVGIIGLANGYQQYIATPEEYRRQNYEGASDLYGRATARTVGAELQTLAAPLLKAPEAPSPPVAVATILANPGPASRILPGRDDAIDTPDTAIHLTATCDTGVTVAHWREHYVGARTISDSLRIRFDVSSASNWTPAAWDDRIDVTVELEQPSRAVKGWQYWRATWQMGALGHAGQGVAVHLLRWAAPWNTKQVSCTH